MKNFIIISLVFLSINTPLHCMKRKNDPTENHAIVLINKKSKHETKKPITLREFFIKNDILDNPIDYFKTLSPSQTREDTHNKPQFIPLLPTEIKNIIRTCKFFNNKQWWYPIKQYKFPETAYGVAFIADKLAIGVDKDIHILDPNKQEKECDVFDIEHSIYSLATNNNYLAYGLHNGGVGIIDLVTEETILNWISCTPHNNVCSLALDKKNQLIAIGRENEEIEINSIKKQKTIFSYKSLKKPYALSFLNKDKLVVGYNDGNIDIINYTKNTKENFVTTTIGLFSFAINKELKIFAIGLEDGKVQIFDQKGTNLLMSADFKSPIYSLSFDAKGEQLAIGIDDHNVKVLKQFHPTTDQLMLRQLIHLFFKVKKLNKDTIKHPHDLLYLIGTVLRLDSTELINMWNTLPEKMQLAIWKKTTNLINEYGHNLCSIKDFTDNNPLVQTMEDMTLYPNLMEDYPLSTPSQLLLLKTMQLFCETQTIKKPFSSPEELIKFIAYFYNLDQSSMLTSWHGLLQNAKTKIYDKAQQLLHQEKN